jgi:hypothetical protein
MHPVFIRGMQSAIDDLWRERDTYTPFTASWRALDNAAKRLCRRRDRLVERSPGADIEIPYTPYVECDDA